ncbi:MAG: DUF547 domain-containing protein [Oligoflexales bacterium]|nr:DUF547 domain-containing protein [Oligoflexales bacterium]
MNFRSLCFITIVLLSAPLIYLQAQTQGQDQLQSSSFNHRHADWSDVLQGYMKDGMVDYKKLKKDNTSQHSFSKYLAQLQKVGKKEFESWNRSQQMAFLINAYNAFTFKLILDHYPVKSIKDIGGLFKKPWSIEFFSLLDGEVKALDPIEHEVLRPRFKDYRIHAAVNCASISCPPLLNTAFVADKIDEQLDGQMKAWLADSNRNKFDLKSKKIEISKIFDWYEKDFVDWGQGLPKVIEKYGSPQAQQLIKAKVEIDYLSYDWNLNEVK